MLFGEWIEFATEQPFHRDWIEDGAILFGPGQKTLIDAMLAVPADASQWDLVDAAGLCVRGFPRPGVRWGALAGSRYSAAYRSPRL